MTQPTKTQQQVAEEYAESCDNESGSFLSRDLIKIRTKAYLAAMQSDEVRGILYALDLAKGQMEFTQDLFRKEGLDNSIVINTASEALAKFGKDV